MIPAREDATSSVYAPTRLAPLDGLRGVAILLVLFFHYEVRSWPYRSGLGMLPWAVIREGWLGVDLFFVLSGFLITGILVDTKHAPHYFRNFYARRALRIFPLYYAYLVAFFLILPALPHFVDWQTPTSFNVQFWFWSYLSNLLIGLRGWAASPNLLSHFWSLSVEEQFYLAWPAIVLLLGRRGLALTCIGCVIGAAAFRIGLRLNDVPWVANVVLTPSRVDGLAMGALVALAVRSTGGVLRLARIARPVLLATGILFVGLLAWRGRVGAVDPSDAVVGTVGLTLCATMFAAVVAACVTDGRRSIAHRVLTNRPLTIIGKYSYAMYVFHPIVRAVFDRLGLSIAALSASIGPQWVAHAAYLSVNTLTTLVLAAFSWHLFESRFIRLKDRFPYAWSSPVPQTG